jgi:hypothetical protein
LLNAPESVSLGVVMKTVQDLVRYDFDKDTGSVQNSHVIKEMFRTKYLSDTNLWWHFSQMWGKWKLLIAVLSVRLLECVQTAAILEISQLRE